MFNFETFKQCLRGDIHQLIANMGIELGKEIINTDIDLSHLYDGKR